MLKVLVIVIIISFVFIYKNNLINTKQQNNSNVFKPEPLPTRKVSEREILIEKIIKKFTESEFGEGGKYLKNFKFKNLQGEEVFLDLVLLTKKGLYVVQPFMCKSGEHYTMFNEDDIFVQYYKNYTYTGRYKSIENPLSVLKEKIKSLKDLDLKYKVYYDPIILFDDQPKYVRLEKEFEDVMETYLTFYGLDYYFNLWSKEEDVYTKDRLDYLYMELNKKRYKTNISA